MHPLFRWHSDPFLGIYRVRRVPNRNLLRSLRKLVHSLPLGDLRGFPFYSHRLFRLPSGDVFHDHDVRDLLHAL
jgi:hypothetical protein